jgi:hypothetical protein
MALKSSTLKDVIYDYLLQHNAKHKHFVWSKTAEDISTREHHAIDKIKRNRKQMSDSEH